MRRWWDLAVALVLIALAIVAVADREAPGLGRWGPVVLLAGMGVVYVVGLRRFVPLQIGGSGPEPGIAAALILQVVTVALMGTAVALNANMMNGMVVVIPLMWLSSPRSLHAVAATIVSASAFGIGFAASQGWTAEGNFSGFSIAAISAAFGIGIGLWISSISTWGAERARLLTELTEAQGELETAHRDAGATAERERLARDIHDTIAQSLASIVMLAERAGREQNPHRTIALLEDAARDALEDSRALVAANAAVEAPASSSLEASLTRLGERVARESGLRVSTSVTVPGRLPRECEVMLLRCTQEGLANVRRHARATRAEVALTRSEPAQSGSAQSGPAQAESEVTLTIRDDGVGLGGVTVDQARGFGLTGMRERAELAGGTLQVRDAASGGVLLTVTVPVGEVSGSDTAAANASGAGTSGAGASEGPA